MIDELRGVLAREHLAMRLAKQRSSVEQAIELYGELAISVSPLAIPRAVPHDGDDDQVIAAALAAGADLVVSGDADLLSLGSFEGVSIVTPAHGAYLPRFALQDERFGAAGRALRPSGGSAASSKMNLMILRYFRAAACGLAFSGAALAQALDLPPPLSSAATAVAPDEPAARPETPSRGGADKSGAITEDDALADRPPVRTISPETRIEQRRRGNRIVELTVTPAGSTRSYTIVNRVGQRPLGIDELSAGLSTPRFIKFEF